MGKNLRTFFIDGVIHKGHPHKGVVKCGRLQMGGEGLKANGDVR